MEAAKNKKVALVTGSASGIGANVAFDLALNGYFILITGRDKVRLETVVARCNEIASGDYPSAISFQADLLDSKQVDELIRFVKLKFDRVDVLVNNACCRGERHKNILGSTDDASYDDTLAIFEEFEQVMHVNVSMPMYLIQQCLLPMRQQNQNGDFAVVINVSSIASQIVVPLHTYSISKACLSEMSHQLGQLSEQFGVYSVTISPGPILTHERPQHQAMRNMTLMNRVGTTQEVSDLILFAIKNAGLLNGQELTIDGGYSIKQR